MNCSSRPLGFAPVGGTAAAVSISATYCMASKNAARGWMRVTSLEDLGALHEVHLSAQPRVHDDADVCVQHLGPAACFTGDVFFSSAQVRLTTRTRVNA